MNMELTPSERITKFITDNFENVTVVNFPLLPYGKRIIDKDGGEMVMYWDVLKQRIKWAMPEGKE
jgi:hypothetical protein